MNFFKIITFVHISDRAARRLKEVGAPETDKRTITSAFHSLQPCDQALIELLASADLKAAAHIESACSALARCSCGAKSPAQLIGALMWLVHYKAVPARFVIFLKSLFDKEMLSEDAIRVWYAASTEQLIATLPGGATAPAMEAEFAALKKSADVFINWLDESEEEEEGSDEEDEN